MKSVIVGTAGHIDHGKTSLVKALTGVDGDRLQEEKRRGITIDIGFAHLELPILDGQQSASWIRRCPGSRALYSQHARWSWRNRYGAPRHRSRRRNQTPDSRALRHLPPARYGARHHVLTKSDAVDAETLEVVRMEVEDFVRGSFLDASRSPIVAISSLTGAGLTTFGPPCRGSHPKSQARTPPPCHASLSTVFSR